MTGIPRSTLYAMIADDQFPKPIKIGERAVAWIETEVHDWINTRERAQVGTDGATYYTQKGHNNV